jgi:hypothetical protein
VDLSIALDFLPETKADCAFINDPKTMTKCSPHIVSQSHLLSSKFGGFVHPEDIVEVNIVGWSYPTAQSCIVHSLD